MRTTTIIQEAAPTEAPPTGAAEPSGNFFIPLLMIGAVFWFVIIMPERKNRKKREALLAGISKGDKVMTTGGLLGSVALVKDDEVTLQVADNVRLRFRREAIQTVLDKKDEPAKESA